MPATVAPMPSDHSPSVIVEARSVSLIRETTTILDSVSITIRSGERWVILGPNGCGKTTLLRMLALYLHPSSGDITVLGNTLGEFDIRPIRPRLAYVSATLLSSLRPVLTCLQVVMSARNGALETWWHDYDDNDEAIALSALERMGVARFANSAIGELSSGEQQRALLARALVNDPIALLLDEPSARLDLGGREQLVKLLDEFASNNPQLPSVIVTHHVDEIPTSTTHCLLMRAGTTIASGPINDTLTSDALSQCFNIPMVVDTRPNGRLTAYAR